MNIIGGIYKGRLIRMPKAAGIRPTSNKVREALFNILGKEVLDAAVLDLFAGSGSLGLEALSRGAGKVVFIDNDSKCIDTIKRNLKGLQPSAETEIMQLGVLQGVKKLGGKTKFKFVFMDPPYFSAGDGDWIKKTLINLGQYDILKNLGLVVCEHHKKETVPEKIGRFQRIRQTRYGDTILSFYRKNDVSYNALSTKQ